MTTYGITFPNKLRGTIALPASKSISARALIIGALAGNITAKGLSDCDDTRVLHKALTQPAGEIDIMAAGTAMRFSTAYFAATSSPARIITGTARMRQRPISLLVEALRSLGADIAYMETEGFPPLRVRGRQLEGGTLSLPATVSSQYISALLMVAPLMHRGLRLHLEGEIASRPYIDMTLKLMRHFGAQADWTAETTLEVKPGTYRHDVAFAVEPDWSAASYWYEMMALTADPEAEILLPGLRSDSVQGDSMVWQLFEPLGVGIRFTDQGAHLYKTPPTAVAETTETDFTAFPDLAQTLVVTHALLGRPFRFTGLHSLKIKETDRIAALQTELCKLGYDIEANGQSMWMAAANSPAADNGAQRIVFNTYEDHRMAMSLAPCALRHKGISIADPGVVSKSYPAFWEDLRKTGACIERLEE